MSTRHNLLRLLADGAFHSGTRLGDQLGVSRAAVHKAVQLLVEAGIEIHCVPGRGYRLAEPFVPLSHERLRAGFAVHDPAVDIEVLDECDSTNQYLLHAADQRSGRVCLAEAQPAGRGRRGRGWIATPYQNIALSLAWRFEAGPAALAGLSLAAGVAVLRALDEFGARDLSLKWPNDILYDGRKLAGLLIDMRAEAAGPSYVVLGLGLNVFLATADAARIGQPWAALAELFPRPIDRNRLAALLIRKLTVLLREFENTGFEAYRVEWERHHLYHNQQVQLQVGEQHISGTVVGIDGAGSLRMRDVRGEVRAYHSGEVSLRGARRFP